MKSLAFRYWSKHDQRWYYNSDDYPLYVFFDDALLDSEHEVQEATGFLDRNGTEIWEGDIVHFNFVEEMRVEWDREIGAWTCGGDLLCNTTMGGTAKERCRVEVMGNRVTHPEKWANFERDADDSDKEA